MQPHFPAGGCFSINMFYHIIIKKAIFSGHFSCKRKIGTSKTCSDLVEMTGVEPVSESKSSPISTSVGYDYFSRRYVSQPKHIRRQLLGVTGPKPYPVHVHRLVYALIRLAVFAVKTDCTLGSLCYCIVSVYF